MAKAILRTLVTRLAFLGATLYAINVFSTSSHWLQGTPWERAGTITSALEDIARTLDRAGRP